MIHRLIDEEKTRHSVSLMSRLLGVSRQGYYKHHTTEPKTAPRPRNTPTLTWPNVARATMSVPVAPTGLRACEPTWPSSTDYGWDAIGSVGSCALRAWSGCTAALAARA